MHHEPPAGGPELKECTTSRRPVVQSLRSAPRAAGLWLSVYENDHIFIYRLPQTTRQARIPVLTAGLWLSVQESEQFSLYRQPQTNNADRIPVWTAGLWLSVKEKLFISLHRQLRTASEIRIPDSIGALRLSVYEIESFSCTEQHTRNQKDNIEE